MVTLDGEVKSTTTLDSCTTVDNIRCGISGGGKTNDPWFVIGKRLINKLAICRSRASVIPNLYSDSLTATDINLQMIYKEERSNVPG